MTDAPISLTLHFDSIGNLNEFISAWLTQSATKTVKRTILPKSDAVDGAHPNVGLAYHGRAWTTSDDDFIVENAPKFKYAEIAKRLDRSVGALRNRVVLLRQEGKMGRKNGRRVVIRAPQGTTIRMGAEGTEIT